MKKRIVHIDDDPIALETIRTLLEQSGEFEVFSFTRANEARDRLGDIDPDLILLDMIMPIMSGSSTIKLLKAFDYSKDYPVVFLTMKTEAEDVRYYLELGAHSVISKPINPETFAVQISGICQSL